MQAQPVSQLFGFWFLLSKFIAVIGGITRKARYSKTKDTVMVRSSVSFVKNKK
jgi:hypothetical protein